MELLSKTNAALKAGVFSVLPNCRQVARLQSDALDRSLPVSQRVKLWFHLLICKWCRRYGEQIHFLHTAAHDRSEKASEAIPQKLSDEARERIKRTLRDEGK